MPTWPPAAPPGSSDETLYIPPLQTDPRLGTNPLLVAGETGAWLIGENPESGAQSTGQATFFEAASGTETRTCAIPLVEQMQVATWGDRLIIAAIDCSRCAQAAPIVAVLDRDGSVVFTWRADRPEQPDNFGVEMVDLGESAIVIISRGPPARDDQDLLLSLQDAGKPGSSDNSAKESVVGGKRPLLCPTSEGLVGVSSPDPTNDNPSLAPVTLSFTNPKTLQPDGAIINQPASGDRFAAPACTGDGVAVLGFEGIASWTPSRGWRHETFASPAERSASVETAPRLIVNASGRLKIMTSHGWQTLNGKPSSSVLASASRRLAVVMDPRADPVPTFTRLA